MCIKFRPYKFLAPPEPLYHIAQHLIVQATKILGLMINYHRRWSTKVPELLDSPLKVTLKRFEKSGMIPGSSLWTSSYIPKKCHARLLWLFYLILIVRPIWNRVTSSMNYRNSSTIFRSINDQYLGYLSWTQSLSLSLSMYMAHKKSKWIVVVVSEWSHYRRI